MTWTCSSSSMRVWWIKLKTVSKNATRSVSRCTCISSIEAEAKHRSSTQALNALEGKHKGCRSAEMLRSHHVKSPKYGSCHIAVIR